MRAEPIRLEIRGLGNMFFLSLFFLLFSPSVYLVMIVVDLGDDGTGIEGALVIPKCVCPFQCH
ncbi:hypothetical protein JMJ77_0008778 [Colletotrichum scovillei]|uniref:Transmembrane protein n=1 Tax=Colletotrichum scovillei TaxID=1209932 RepID=A0A9P7QTY3_9PEZI|nr:hypothetical protein JMJ78_0001634 [Colletotrichum scovillei]KAG7041073.1 hypothetical protein JMJ77_0008778 [Colletotrichum scovillei]KAG7061106.1 hypothetical protein JMJ76_0010176 [Colletotrichum scovillei]